jgi:hypothetical protein
MEWLIVIGIFLVMYGLHRIHRILVYIEERLEAIQSNLPRKGGEEK